jgi:hypothetical protein
MFFHSAMGQWDFSIYQDMSYPLVGETFHVLFLFLNIVMFVNLIIAILQQTY